MSHVYFKKVHAALSNLKAAVSPCRFQEKGEKGLCRRVDFRDLHPLKLAKDIQR